jgi:hypothetical protein
MCNSASGYAFCLGYTLPCGGADSETRMDTVLPTLATKADVAEAKATIVMWLAGVIAAATAIIITVLAFMLNRAVPPQATTQAAPPIIIYPQQQSNSQEPQSPPASKRDR